MSQVPNNRPETKQELLDRVQGLNGLTIGQSARRYGLAIPENLRHHKGWFGHLMERVLGADAQSKPMPDFTQLGIELKTLPIGNNGKPSESTFVASINLLKIHQENWETSVVKKKLSQVLWLPMEGNSAIPLSERRIGLGFIWYPTPQQMDQLAEDWRLLTELIVLGKLENISAHLGRWLQIRPKAANGKALTSARNEAGTVIKTLPRGFYLRSRFTYQLLLDAMANESALLSE